MAHARSLHMCAEVFLETEAQSFVIRRYASVVLLFTALLPEA